VLPPERKNQQTDVPLAHYLARYRALDPREAASRCALAFDEAASAFSLRLMGTEYRASFPGFDVRDGGGRGLRNPYERILLARYLCEGRHVAPRGAQLAYQEIPWGQVYYTSFRGRCIERLARAFGADASGLKRAAESLAIRAEPLAAGDAAYRFEFMNGLYMSVLLWGADDEFPASAQMLFDDNFAAAFTAEDIAAAGEIAIARLKEAAFGGAERPSSAFPYGERSSFLKKLDT
jgi:hypothetical protein